MLTTPWAHVTIRVTLLRAHSPTCEETLNGIDDEDVPEVEPPRDCHQQTRLLIVK